jgi:elongation factor G
VPSAELTRYAIDLRALTGGRGTFVFEADHYDTVPEHLTPMLVRSSS